MSRSHINIKITTGVKPKHLTSHAQARSGTREYAVAKAKDTREALRKLKSDFLTAIEKAKREELDKIDEQIEVASEYIKEYE